MADPEAERHFREMYDVHYSRVLAYARRRVEDHLAAQDVVAEVFTIAWRRWADVPDPPATLPWLLATAHRCAANIRRAAGRQQRLRQRLVGFDPPAGVDPEDAPAVDVVRQALARLRPADAEILRLAVWDELDHAAIAVVLDCSVNVVGVRLHRARARLRTALVDLGAVPVPARPHRQENPR